MNAERPKFQGTAEKFAEFKRGWNEYHRIIKANSPGTNEGQKLHFSKRVWMKGLLFSKNEKLKPTRGLRLPNF
jgi:hypothetical protein